MGGWARLLHNSCRRPECSSFDAGILPVKAPLAEMGDLMTGKYIFRNEPVEVINGQ